MNVQRKVVAIHQPNFFPWLGYFDKIARADVFVLMDNVQFPKKGGTWSNRVQLAANGKAAWVTMPLVRSFHGTRIIRDIKIDNSVAWRESLLKTIQTNYGRAPFFGAVFSLLKSTADNPTDSLAEYNEAAIRAIVAAIGLDVSKLVRGSEIKSAGTATDLLINMTRALDGTAYLCGGGASGYQEDNKFETAGIELIYQNFIHPVYAQCNAADFIPGLSVIDALMNVGFDGVRSMLGGTASGAGHE